MSGQMSPSAAKRGGATSSTPSGRTARCPSPTSLARMQAVLMRRKLRTAVASGSVPPPAPAVLPFRVAESNDSALSHQDTSDGDLLVISNSRSPARRSSLEHEDSRTRSEGLQLHDVYTPPSTIRRVRAEEDTSASFLSAVGEGVSPVAAVRGRGKSPGHGNTAQRSPEARSRGQLFSHVQTSPPPASVFGGLEAGLRPVSSADRANELSPHHMTAWSSSRDMFTDVQPRNHHVATSSAAALASHSPYPIAPSPLRHDARIDVRVVPHLSSAAGGAPLPSVIDVLSSNPSDEAGLADDLYHRHTLDSVPHHKVTRSPTPDHLQHRVRLVPVIVDSKECATTAVAPLDAPRKPLTVTKDVVRAAVSQTEGDHHFSRANDVLVQTMMLLDAAMRRGAAALKSHQLRERYHLDTEKRPSATSVVPARPGAALEMQLRDLPVVPMPVRGTSSPLHRSRVTNRDAGVADVDPRDGSNSLDVQHRRRPIGVVTHTSTARQHSRVSPCPRASVPRRSTPDPTRRGPSPNGIAQNSGRGGSCESAPRLWAPRHQLHAAAEPKHESDQHWVSPTADHVPSQRPLQEDFHQTAVPSQHAAVCVEAPPPRCLMRLEDGHPRRNELRLAAGW